MARRRPVVGRAHGKTGHSIVRLFVHKSLGLAYVCYFSSFELSFIEARI